MDEASALRKYVLYHYRHLMTEFERWVDSAYIGRIKAKAASERNSHEMAEMLNRKWAAVGDTAVDAALADGIEAFKERVYQRLMSERTGDIFINRCPRCNGLTRTPKAQQCFKCGFDWHGVEKPES